MNKAHGVDYPEGCESFQGLHRVLADTGHSVDEEREDRLEREGAPTDLIKRALIGALACAILGFLYFGVWALAFGPNWHAALAALAASAVFGSIIGVAGVWVAPKRFKDVRYSAGDFCSMQNSCK